jgi:hypothetical protein
MHFYQSKLIPRRISDWCLVGGALLLAMGFLRMFGHSVSFLAIPIILNEMFLAVWLIVKGFNVNGWFFFIHLSRKTKVGQFRFTKLFVSLTRSDLASRQRPITLVNMGLHRKLAIMPTPAGFGKITLVSKRVSGCVRGANYYSRHFYDMGMRPYI